MWVTEMRRGELHNEHQQQSAPSSKTDALWHLQSVRVLDSWTRMRIVP